VKEWEELKKYTTIKIGGKCKLVVIPQGKEGIKEAIKVSENEKLPLTVIGNGSNVLFPDGNLEWMILKITTPYFGKMFVENSSLYVHAGVDINKVIEFSMKEGITGLEFLSGIPGKIGGVVVMNAGGDGKSVSEVIENVEVMSRDGEKVYTLDREECKFNYRDSRFRISKEIVLGVRFKVRKTTPQEVEQKVTSILQERRKKFPFAPNLGCIFKNPPTVSAAKLIEKGGLKGYRIGGVEVSEKHANFIINKGGGRSEEVKELIEVIKRKVYQKFKIYLSPEIVIL
jgi:UDP-N-acetylmuramate dehydrogenase